MKNIFVCFVLALTCWAASAQVTQTIGKKSYKELKTLYDPHDYVATFSDKYSPAWSGVASFFIPGLGEAICGEWGRAAIRFLAPSILVYVGGAIGAGTESYAPAYLCYAGALAIDIWSVIDAVKIAKVKNMYFQDALSKTASLDIDLAPSFAYVNTGNGVQPTAGMSLRISF